MIHNSTPETQIDDTIINVVAGEDIEVRQSTIVASSNNTSGFTMGYGYLADVDNIDRSTNVICRGIALTSATAGNTYKLKVLGIVGGYSGLTPGASCYMSATSGSISESGSDDNLIGIALTSSELYLYPISNTVDTSPNFISVTHEGFNDGDVYNTNLHAYHGVCSITEKTTNKSAIFHLQYQSVLQIISSDSIFSNTKDTVLSINFYYEDGSFKVQNNTGNDGYEIEVVYNCINSIAPGEFVSADLITESATRTFVTATVKEKLDAIISSGMYNLWIDGALKYADLEQSSITNPASTDYTSLFIRASHSLTTGTRGNITFSIEDLIPGISSKVSKCYQIVADAADSGLDDDSYYRLQYFVPNGVKHYGNGQKLSFSFKINSDIDSHKIGIMGLQTYGTGGSPSSEILLPGGAVYTLNSGENTIEHNFTTESNDGKTFGTNNDDAIVIEILIQAGNTASSAWLSGDAFGFTEATTLKFYEFQLNVGEEANDFIFTDDIVRVINQYIKSYDNDVAPGTTGDYVGALAWTTMSTNATSWPDRMVFFPCSMRVVPNVTLYSPGTGTQDKAYVWNASTDIDADCDNLSRKSFRLRTDSVSADQYVSVHWVADARY